MKSIAVVNQKGGVGKTTIATHLAWYCAEQKGESVLVCDLDPQGNATSTLASCQVHGVTTSQLFGADFDPSTVGISATPGAVQLLSADRRLVEIDKEPTSSLMRFVRALNVLGESFDRIVVDVGPSLGNRMHAALFACECLVCPIEPETYALEGVVSMMQTHRQIAQVKAKHGLSLTFLGILVMKVNRTYPRHRETLTRLLHDHGEKILPVYSPMRSAVGEAQAARKPVWDLGSSSAREAGKEMAEICEYLHNKMAVA
ncbi:ParA family protein [Xanthomonas phaseoli pv. dieffenbachiae]|uniref:ParA family protein n=1 Tax=Xanthomonas phaseoli TaxID=1985254 RepID=UPI001ADB3A2C|nr:ParA family protein [Xanthomonas phaseoli]MBO9900315.1 ParA family protein [Xanthomonas phaseoli pv. dieffenbachiae]